MTQIIQKKSVLSPRHIQLLLGFLYENQYSIADIRSFITEKVSTATLKRDISVMKKAGYIEQTGEKRGAKYHLSVYGLLHRPLDPKKYFLQPEGERQGATGFNFRIFDILKNNVIFSHEEIKELEEATALFYKKSLHSTHVIHTKELQRFVIELSWKSSRIEGNTYTLLDTERLLTQGIPAEGKTKDETTMILNHKKAFDYILELRESQKNITLVEIENIHRLLVTDLNVSYGIRNAAVGITGSSYLPLSLRAQIRESLEKLVEVITAQKTSYEKSFLAILMMSYLQPFEDGNKRTARLLGNAYLLLGHCAPLSYRNVDEVLYRESLLVFYEQYSLASFKNIFIEQYVFACKHYNVAEQNIQNF